MSFLDDLKREAEQVKRRGIQARTASDMQRETAFSSVQSCIDRLYRYLKDACARLVVVNPDVYASYEVRGFGTMGSLRQSNYRLMTENPENLTKFTLAFECARPERLRCEVKGKEVAAAMKEYLWSCNLRFTFKLNAKDDGIFFIEAFVPVTLEFIADMEATKIILRERNFDALVHKRSAYAPAVINDEFMDELVKRVTRRDNRFDELSGNILSEDARMALRQQIEQERTVRERETLISPPDSAKKKKKKGLLRSLFLG